MAYLLPISTDPLNSPDHSLLHRIITVDSAATEQSLKIDSSSNAILLGGVSVDTAFTGKQIATPSNPAASYNKMYFKSGDRLYLLTSGGTESLVGNISGSTGATDNAILRADGTGGTTLQTTGITIDDNDNIVLPTSAANNQKGIIYRGSSRWLHNYYPTNAGGLNIFLGQDAGNFTMTADVGEIWESSNLIGIGPSTLSSITQGYLLIAIGNSAYAAMTIGSAGIAAGHYSFQRNTQQAGTAFGHASGRYVIGYANSVFGSSAGVGVDTVSTYSYTSLHGAFSGMALTTGSFNTLIGTYSGANLTTGQSNIIISCATTQGSAATLVSGSSNIIIGTVASMALSSTSVSNEMNIANVLYATGLYGTGRFGIGVTNANITARLHLAAGSTSASSAPLKFTSGSLMSTAEAGAMEFLTDAFYLTITTGAARQQIVTDTNTVTLTNKTLTSPVISTIVNTGTLTLPTSTDTLVGRATTDTLTNKTLTAPKIASGGFIADANGNELIIFTTSASAINDITFANASAGNNPKFSATGGDSSIGIDFQTKGSGTYRLLGTSTQAAELRLFENTNDGSNYTGFKVGTQATDITYTLPTAGPAANGYVLTSTTGGVMSWSAMSGGMALAGSDLTDRTTTSTTTTDLSSVTGLAIPAATPILVIVDWRKSGTAAEYAMFSIKVNGTTIYAEDSWSANGGSSEYGMARFYIGPRSTNYVRGLEGQATRSGGAGKVLSADTNNLPTADITSITITGKNQSTTANTVGTNNMRVYTLPTA